MCQSEVESSINKKEDFEMFFNSIEDMVFIADIEGNILFSNNAVIKKLGYNKEELKYKKILDLHPKEYLDKAEKIFGAMFKGERDTCPIPLIKKNNEYIPVETRIWLGKWNGEKCIYGISKDLSVEQAALEKFHKLFDNNPALMALSDLKTKKFIDVNYAFLEKLGYDKSEIIGKNSEELGIFCEPDKQKRTASEMAKIGKIRDIELDVRKKNGEIIRGLFSGDIIDNQIEKAFLTVMIDITDITKIKTKLIDRTILLNGLIDSIPDLIFLKNKEGIYLECNTEFCRFVGKSKEGIIKHSDYDLFNKELADFFRYNDNIVMEIKSKRNNEEWVNYPNGKKILLDTIKAPLLDLSGNLIGIVGLGRDITEKNKAKNELKLAKKAAESANIMKSKFLANMSHDIRTPMNGIMGFLDLLDSSDLDNEQKEYVRDAKSASKVLLYLINDILDFSKIEAGKLDIENKSFDILKTVEDTLNLIKPMAKEKGIDTNFYIDKEVPRYIVGDWARIRQILNNLLGNAIKFTQKGEIDVRLECLEKTNDIAKLRFQVVDTGIGIKQSAIYELFEPFTQGDISITRNYGGTGLGLAISKKLINLMKGEIRVESEIGKGSRFIFEIPFEISKDIEYKEDSNNIVNEKEFNSDIKILVVEDNFINSKIIDTVLKKNNMKCDLARNGKEAIDLICENDYDIVFMDCHMPVLDGYEATKKIRKMEGNKKDTPIIAMTANAMDGDREVCIAAGMDDYISKPINFDILFEIINKYIY